MERTALDLVVDWTDQYPTLVRVLWLAALVPFVGVVWMLFGLVAAVVVGVLYVALFVVTAF